MAKYAYICYAQNNTYDFMFYREHENWYKMLDLVRSELDRRGLTSKPRLPGFDKKPPPTDHEGLSFIVGDKADFLFVGDASHMMRLELWTIEN